MVLKLYIFYTNHNQSRLLRIAVIPVLILRTLQIWSRGIHLFCATFVKGREDTCLNIADLQTTRLLLGRYDVSWGKWLPALRKMVVPSSSESSNTRRPPDAENEGLRSFETSESTRPTTKRHNSDDFNLQNSEIRWPSSVLSVLADLQKGQKKSEKLVREIRIHVFVTGWSCISDGENKNPYRILVLIQHICILPRCLSQGCQIKFHYRTTKCSVYKRRHTHMALRTDWRSVSIHDLARWDKEMAYGLTTI